eukprot:754660-Hanusia_phi.AAC.6
MYARFSCDSSTRSATSVFLCQGRLSVCQLTINADAWQALDDMVELPRSYHQASFVTRASCLSPMPHMRVANCLVVILGGKLTRATTLPLHTGIGQESSLERDIKDVANIIILARFDYFEPVAMAAVRLPASCQP